MINKTIQEIMKEKDKFTMDKVIPLKNLTDEKTLKKYTKIFFDLQEINLKVINELLKISDKFYWSNNFSCWGVIYLDLDKYICLNFNYINLKADIKNKKNNIISNILGAYDKYNAKQFDYLLAIVPDDLKIVFLLDLNKKVGDLISSENYYKLFMDFYTSIDNNFNELTEIMKNIFSYKSENQKTKTRKLIQTLPDTITIYRGEGNRSTPYTNAFSWSLDINKANFYAIRLADDTARLIKAEISKKDVLEYFEVDSEILVLPNNLKNIKVLDIMSIQDIMSDIYTFYDIFSSYKNKLSNKVEFIRKNISSEHDKKHSLRVLFYCLLLGTYEGLNEEELNLLATIAIYHDCGRTNDIEDEAHGRESYNVFLKSNNDNQVIKFIMTYHCIDDVTAKTWLNDSFLQNKDKILLMYNIFKDSDALDRLRFGFNDLDLNYLRLENSLKLTLVAKQCQHGLQF